MDATRLFDLLEIQNKNVPNDPFLSSKVNGTWVTYTFKEVQQYANRASQLLLNIGLKKGDAIALISANRPEWNFIDFGAMQIGVTVVPMYPTIAERDYEYIFNDAACYAFIDNEVVYNKVKPLLQKISSFKGIYSFDKLPNVPSLIASLPATVQLSEIDKRKKATTEEDIATIIYTSGTTGNPKGVMLTHKNILSDIYAVKKVINFGNGEKSLSFLPLCHSFERMVFYAYLAFRIHIHYAENLEKIGENLVEVKPYCFTTVPRMLEKVYDKIIAKGNALTGIKKQLFFGQWRLAQNMKLANPKARFIYYNLLLPEN